MYNILLCIVLLLSHQALELCVSVNHTPSPSLPGFAASQAGIIPGCCILKVGEEEVLNASHDVVVSAVRGSLSRSKVEQGKSSVRLKLSFPFLEQLSLYKYECADTTLVEVFERTVESPYTFSLPAQVNLCLQKYSSAVHIIMPRCACASEVYGSVFVCACLSV